MNPIDPIELLSYLLIEEGKRGVMSVVQDLIRLDQRLCDIALSLPIHLLTRLLQVGAVQPPAGAASSTAHYVESP